MIGYIRGLLVQKQPPWLLLDVNGVGYELEAPMSTFYVLPEAQNEISLYVHMLVRQDAQLLFGFSDQGQRELFRSLIRINGVGPRVALAILSTLDTREFVNCIQHEDVAMLTRVPGIGKKTAERMIIDMRDRIDDQQYDAAPDGATRPLAAADHPIQDAIGALMALGYKAPEARRAVNAVKAQSERRDDLIRNALQFFTTR